ncbi:MAG: Glycosyl transferase family 2 [Candidatus Levybacteria bacterium GW2011_GWC1_40_19]|nr:MAG: Glycosyl transferase family 2 [Candidatus Levybacteria bacterium GW2011_GWC1_40_19]
MVSDELKREEIEIIVVDNASSDGSLEAISKYISDKKGLRLIGSRENLGFGKGNNLGASQARGETLIFLNSDTEVLDKGFLEMADFLTKNQNIGILGPKLINFDGTIQPSAANFYGLPNLLIMLLGLEKRKSPEGIEKVDWITGAATMVRKEVFEEIGMFDKNIFMYMEDHELCFRAKKKGFATYFFPGAIVRHKSVGSSNKAFAIVSIYKNILYFYKKHMPHWQYRVARFLLLTKALLIVYLGKIIRNRYYVNTYREAMRALSS